MLLIIPQSSTVMDCGCKLIFKKRERGWLWHYYGKIYLDITFVTKLKNSSFHVVFHQNNSRFNSKMNELQ